MHRFFRKCRRFLRKARAAFAGRLFHVGFCLICALVIVVCAGYLMNWFSERDSVEDEQARYRAMYAPADLAGAGEGDSTAGIQAEVSFEPSATPAQTPVSSMAAVPVSKRTLVGTMFSPTSSPNASPTARSTPAPLPTVPSLEAYTPLPTADEQTRVYSLPTPPPLQDSFSELLLFNPDTIGYLNAGEKISLPVVWRENDNEYYLTHSFAREEAREGALFLDGANRILEGDPVWILYGHNMKNGTMFGSLKQYDDLSFLKENALVRFDTIYENGMFIPFAMFSASMFSDASHYFDVRQFALDETEFELFVLRMRSRSTFEIPVDVEYGDQLLLLVTCSYDDSDGRYILALRRLRPDETGEEMLERISRIP